MTNPALRGLTPPFYLCDMQRLEAKYESFTAAFRRYFQHVVVGYSYKTNYVPYLCRTLHQLGAHAEVVSPLEYRLACTLGVPGERIIFNGPGKRPADLAMALANRSRINLDSLDEARYVARWAREHPDLALEIGLRVNLPLPSPAGDQRRSRFGLEVESGDLARAAEMLHKAGSVRVSGLHAHQSSKRRGLEEFRSLAKVLVQAAGVVGEAGLSFLDVGGGFGYAPSSMGGLRFPSFEEYAATLHQELANGLRDLSALHLIVEPGIALVGDCMSYYAPVLAVKRSGNRNLLVVDASVHTVKPTGHPYNLPTNAYNADLVEKTGPSVPFDIVGYTCMEHDVLATDILLPALEVGDILSFDNVGAYCIVFKPPFIRPTPPVYALGKDGVVVAKEDERFEDVFRGYVF